MSKHDAGDFHARLAANLADSSSTPVESRSNSLRSILSRQESRANSLLSTIIINDNESTDSITKDESNSDVSTNDVVLHTIPDLIHTLNLSTRSSTRTGIGKSQRDALFAHLYRMLISVNPVFLGDSGYNETDFANLIAIKPNKSNNDINDNDNFEYDAWLHSVVAYGCAGVDEVASDIISQLFPILFNQINEGHSKDTAVWSIASLLLFVFHDTDAHGMLDHTKMFLQIATKSKSTADDNNDHISAALYGAALTLGLAAEAGRNVLDFIEDEILVLIQPLIETGSSTTKVAASVLAGSCYEIFKIITDSTADDDDDDDDNNNSRDNEFIIDEFNQIVQLLHPLAQEGSKKIGKKGKTAKNLFKHVIETLSGFKTSNEIDNIAVSKNKNISVSTWFAYVRIQTLRFVFANETSTWFTQSRDIRGMLKRKISGSIVSDDDEDDGEMDIITSKSFIDKAENRKSQKERSLQLNKDRLQKLGV